MRRRTRRRFAVVELCLFLAIPLLGYLGFRTLLDTRTGTFIEDPGPDEPGWVALVDPSPVVGVVEMDQGAITGVAVIVGIGETARGGAVVLVPAELMTSEGVPLNSLTAESAIDAVAETMRLAIPSREVVDAQRWTEVLGTTTYSLDNPDPVPGESDDFLFEVGRVEVSASSTSAFLGRTVDGADSLAALVRRELFWKEVLASPPPENDDSLNRTIQAVSGGPHEVARLPLVRGAEGAPAAEPDLTEDLVRRVVAFPAGDQPGRRLLIRIEDRTGSADLDAAARSLGRTGIEVVAISNGAMFDDAATEVRVEPGSEQIEELRSAFPGVDVVVNAALLPGDPAVLQLGPGHVSLLAGWDSG
ncbi:MAG: hypothetical protein HKN24_11090 [Acidimicrobiales bacterium]|nr:hypothetical protein [Acidimicrobiales bacterium]